MLYMLCNAYNLVAGVSHVDVFDVLPTMQYIQFYARNCCLARWLTCR
jgi:hypothetical protein